jgi:two-component system response regulator YesN
MGTIKHKSLSGHRVFVSLLVPNLLLLLLPLLVGWVIYNQTLNVMEKEIIAANMNMLQQSRDIVDRRLSEIASISMRIANDPRIVKFQNNRGVFKDINVYSILDTRKSIYNFSLTNNFIFNYFIVYRNNEVILEESRTYDSTDFYKSFQYAGMDQAAWAKLLFNSYLNELVLPAQEVTVNGTAYSLVTYIKSLGYPGFPQGAVVITVDNREIQKLLGGSNLADGGWTYVINKAGEVISSVSSEPIPYQIEQSGLSGNEGSVVQPINGKDMFVTYTTSAVNGWTYLVAQPVNVVLEKVLYIKKITFTLAFIFLTIGLFFAYVFAYRNSRPLKHIMQTILERTDWKGNSKTDTYRFIKDSVSQLIDNNREMKEKMEKQIPLLQAALFERLLKGENVSLKDVPVLLQHFGIEQQGKYYAAVILHMRRNSSNLDPDVLEQLDMVRINVKDILQQEILDHAHWHDATEDQIVLLFSFGLEDSSDRSAHLEEMLIRIDEAIEARLNLSVKFASGNVYEGLLNISRSYEEAKEAMDYLIWRNRNGAIRFDQMPKESNGYYYPADMERRLGNLAKAGDHENVTALLQELYRINFKEKHLLVPMLRLFIHVMWGSVFKLLPQVGMEEGKVLEYMTPFTGDTASYEGLEKNYRSLADIYRQVCDFVGVHKKSQNELLLEKIQKLLHGSYAQADLCLDSVAERMNISTGYLSQFYKEQTGTNFSEYLEELRMEHAKALLARTDLPVYEIAQQVGYSSSNTFCRAFKRINGVSTTVYRQ